MTKLPSSLPNHNNIDNAAQPRPQDGTQLLLKVTADRRCHGAPLAIMAVLVLGHYNWKTGQCDPSIPRLSEETGYSESAVIRALQLLESLTYLQITQHGGGGALKSRRRNSYSPNFGCHSGTQRQDDGSVDATYCGRMTTRAAGRCRRASWHHRGREMNAVPQRARLAADNRPHGGALSVATPKRRRIVQPPTDKMTRNASPNWQRLQML